MHFNEDRQVFILADGRIIGKWAALEAGSLINTALKEGCESEFNYQKTKQVQNEVLKLRAELEAAEAILLLYHQAGKGLLKKINYLSETKPFESWIRLGSTFSNLAMLTPASVGEEFNAMRSALMEARHLLGFRVDPASCRLVQAITGILGPRG